MQGCANIADIPAVHIEQFVDFEPGDDAPRVAVGVVRFVRVDGETVLVEDVAQLGREEVRRKAPRRRSVASNSAVGGWWLEKVMSSA